MDTQRKEVSSNNMLIGYEVMPNDDNRWVINLKHSHVDYWIKYTDTFETQYHAILQAQKLIDRDLNEIKNNMNIIDYYPSQKPKEGSYSWINGKGKFIPSDDKDVLWYMKDVNTSVSEKCFYLGQGWNTEKEVWSIIAGRIFVVMEHRKDIISRCENMMSSMEITSDSYNFIDKEIERNQRNLMKLQERFDFIQNGAVSQ